MGWKGPAVKEGCNQGGGSGDWGGCDLRQCRSGCGKGREGGEVVVYVAGCEGGGELGRGGQEERGVGARGKKLRRQGGRRTAGGEVAGREEGSRLCILWACCSSLVAMFDHPLQRSSPSLVFLSHIPSCLPFVIVADTS